jgi:hypothetical protein
MTTSARSLVRSLVVDGMILGGVGLVSLGTWEISRPAGLIALGAQLLALGLAAVHRRRRAAPEVK